MEMAKARLLTQRAELQAKIDRLAAKPTRNATGRDASSPAG